MEYAGWDVSKEDRHFYVKDGRGRVLAAEAVTDPRALFEVLRGHCLCPEKIVQETGAVPNWLARGLLAPGSAG